MTRAILVGALLLMVVARTPSADAAPALKSKKIDPLILERIKALESQLEEQWERFRSGRDPLPRFLDHVRDLATYQLLIAETHQVEISILDRAVSRLRTAQEAIENLRSAGLQTNQAVAQVRDARIEAEIRLERRKSAR